MPHTLSKTDFKEYLICPKWIWLKKNKPEQCVEGEMSLFMQKLAQDGYEVEAYAQQLFLDGINVIGNKEVLIATTKALMGQHKSMFQATFQTAEGLFAKIDVLAFDPETSRWNIYEIKASSEIKTDLQHNHIKDIIFQTITAEDAGVDVGKSFIIHINKEYRRNGDINPNELFVVEDVTEIVSKEKENVRMETNEALSLLRKEDVTLDGCDCLFKSHGQRCDSFELFNPQVPKYSVHHVVTGKKLQALLSDNILNIKDIPDDFEPTDIQRGKVLLQKSGQPFISTDAIRETLSTLVFPLYFLDYETFGKPYPILDGYMTNQQIVFQVSIHVIEESGDMRHFEYLGSDLKSATTGLLEMMKANIGPVGNVIVWNEGFEKGRNTELAKIHPEYKGFLDDINSRIFDLMLVFKKDFLHPDFNGSASIKKVLPVLLPELSYKSLEIQDGTMAMSEWERSMKGVTTEEERKKIRENLLTYCKLDTLAMVEIWNVLKKSISK